MTRVTPDLDRLARAVHLSVERIGNRDAWVVTGGKGSHIVKDDACDCADFAMRRTACKHLLAVALRTSGDPDVLAALRQLVSLPTHRRRTSSDSRRGRLRAPLRGIEP